MINRDPKGFTLIELMIVVAIIGVLAAVAVPAYSYFVKASKTADGLEKVKSIADGAVMYYNTAHHFNANGLEKRTHIYPGCQSENAAFAPCTFATNPICTNAAGTLAAPAAIAGIPYPQVGTKTTHNAALYNNIQWQRLGFQVGGPTYYCYSYKSQMGQKEVAPTTPGGDSTLENTGYEFTAAAAASLQALGDSWVYISGTAEGGVTPLYRNE